MKTINKRRLIYCLTISVILNGTFFIQQLFDHRDFEKRGIIKQLYVKSLIDSELTFFQKVKYTSVAAVYFLTSNGDSIHNITKNTWALKEKTLKGVRCYLPLDSVIYDSKSPKKYQLISEFRNYSNTYSAINYFFVGPIFFTVWFYFMTVIIEKGLGRFRKK